MHTVKTKSYLRGGAGITVLSLRNLFLLEIQARIDDLGIHKIAFETDDEEIFHVGSLCFSSRYRIGGTSLYQCRRADLNPQRAKALDGWARTAVTEIKTGAITHKTFISNSRLLNQLIVWSQKSGHENLFESEQHYYAAYSGYSKFVYDQYMIGKWTYHTGILKQNYPYKIIHTLFPESTNNFKPALPKIPVEHSANETQVPKEQQVAHALKLCRDVFTRFSTVLVTSHAYPFKAEIIGDNVWIVPDRHLCQTKNVTPPEKSLGIWDYATGCPIPTQTGYRIKRYQKALRTISEENQNSNILTPHRHRLAKWAHDCFLFLFAANTGMNEQQIRDLKWSDGEYQVVPSIQGFRTIKWRAGNKAQSFTIATIFVKEFDRYLKLRTLILHTQHVASLFFNIPVKPHQRIKPLHPGALRKLGDTIRNYLDSTFPFLSYRQIRLYKYNYLLKEYGLLTASQLMQSSPGTIAKAYSSAADEVATKEISAYYNLLSSAVKKRQETIPPGHCIDPGNAIPVVEIEQPVEPACENFITCIFCEHFVVHATKNDARKIYSLKYFLGEIRQQCKSSDEFEKLNGPTIAKIDVIIEKLKGTSAQFADLMNTIEIEVNEKEQLSDYWLSLLNSLVHVGAII